MTEAGGDPGGRAALGPIIGVIVSTDDLPRLVRFYRDTLGLATYHERERVVNFQWGELRLTLTRHDQVNGRSRDPLREMINFGVRDIHAAHRRLRAAGVEFLRPPQQEPWGGWIATFSDPDGNTLQLIQLEHEPAS